LIESHSVGSFYEPGNSQALAAAVIRFADDPPLHQRVAANARREFDKHFSARSVYTGLAAFLEDHAVPPRN